MNRRNFIFAAVALAAAAGVRQSAAASNAADYIRGVYRREIARHNSQQPADNDAFYALFTREMHELMTAPRVPNPNVPIGLIVHALFGSGALPGRKVTLREVTTIREDQGAAAVKISLAVLDNPRDVVVFMRRQDGDWRISDVEYAPGDTLSAQYRRMTGR